MDFMLEQQGESKLTDAEIKEEVDTIMFEVCSKLRAFVMFCTFITSYKMVIAGKFNFRVTTQQPPGRASLCAYSDFTRMFRYSHHTFTY